MLPRELVHGVDKARRVFVSIDVIEEIVLESAGARKRRRGSQSAARHDFKQITTRNAGVPVALGSSIQED